VRLNSKKVASGARILTENRSATDQQSGASPAD
jgi:hypothetical protein